MNKKKLKSLSITLVITLLLVATGVLLLEKSGVTNFSNRADESSDESVSTESLLPTNTVDYGPTRSEDNTTVPDKMVDPVTPATTDQSLSVVITSARKSGDKLLVKAVSSSANPLSCTATLRKDSVTHTSTSGSALIENQNSCKDLFFELYQIKISGEWDLDVTVKDAGGATASNSIKVIL